MVATDSTIGLFRLLRVSLPTRRAYTRSPPDGLPQGARQRGQGRLDARVGDTAERRAADRTRRSSGPDRAPGQRHVHGRWRPSCGPSPSCLAGPARLRRSGARVHPGRGLPAEAQEALAASQALLAEATTAAGLTATANHLAQLEGDQIALQIALAEIAARGAELTARSVNIGEAYTQAISITNQQLMATLHNLHGKIRRMKEQAGRKESNNA
jgi:hypothetical protein